MSNTKCQYSASKNCISSNNKKSQLLYNSIFASCRFITILCHVQNYDDNNTTKSIQVSSQHLNNTNKQLVNKVATSIEDILRHHKVSFDTLENYVGNKKI